MKSPGLLDKVTGFALWAFAAAAAVSCDSSDTCAAGNERCRCRPTQTCNSGLTCASGLCVNLGSATPGPGTGGAAGAAVAQAGAAPVAGGPSSSAGNGAGGSDASAGSSGSGGSAGAPTNPTNCPALRVSLVGAPGQSVAEDATALADWLEQYAQASVETVTEAGTITPELLEGQDLVILRDLAGWSFTTEQVDAFEAWVQAGGGVISLSGFSSNPEEVTPTNQLLEFAGVAYQRDDRYTEFDNCTQGPMPVEGWDTGHPIAADVTAVGAYFGRSITASGGTAVPVATADGTHSAVAAEAGAGRVFAFTDEWITYVSRWRTAATSDPNCEGKTARDVFQVGQFWQNAIRWATHCDAFVIQDPELDIVN